MRLRARSPLRARAWPDEPTSRECPNRPPADPLAFVRAERISIQKVLAADDVFVGQVGDPEVGVVTSGDVTFSKHVKSARDVGGADLRDTREVEPVLSQ